MLAREKPLCRLIDRDGVSLQFLHKPRFRQATHGNGSGDGRTIGVHVLSLEQPYVRRFWFPRGAPTPRPPCGPQTGGSECFIAHALQGLPSCFRWLHCRFMILNHKKTQVL
jgi:hypothetical protein